MSDPVPTRLEMFFHVLSNPYLLLQGTIEYLMVWFFTRPWSSLILFSPALLLAVSATLLIAYGSFISDKALVQRYSMWLDRESNRQTLQTTSSLPALDGGKDRPVTARATPPSESEGSQTPYEQLIETEEISPFAELLFRRLLILEDFNARASYLVATQMGRNGRVRHARRLMRAVAPEGKEGYAPAHAWLAVDRLARLGVKDVAEQEQLLHDLEAASNWQGVKPALLSIYADVLEQSGRVGEALRVLNKASKTEPALQVKLANMAYRNNRKHQLEQASLDAKRRIQERIDNGSVNADEYASLANLFLLELQPDKAIEMGLRGLKLDPESMRLRRLISEGYRIKYKLKQQTADGEELVDLTLLDIALKSDPTNPAVGEEVARLVSEGFMASTRLKLALQNQLVEGKATAMTHLLIAVANIKQGKTAEAIPSLELALTQAPNAPVIQNNLALALAIEKPSEIARSLELMKSAIASAPNSDELRDTLGDILMIKDDVKAAIASYEEAIRLNGQRVNSRRKLADAYESIGLVDLAEAQRKRIQAIATNKSTE